MWLDTFNQMRKDSGMSLDELCAKSGVPKGTLTKITSGVTKAPALETMRSLVYAMGYTLDDLSEGLKVGEEFNKVEKAHIQKYRLLDPYGKEAVNGVLDVESRRCEAARANALREQREQMKAGTMVETDNVFYITNWFPLMPMSAGTGQIAGSDEPEELELKKRPPRGTSYIAPVSGDSMEPTYQDGDKLFIRSCKNIEVGQIGVFLMDGQQWVKELGNGVLISHNDKYAPIPMRDDIECQGLVLGVCDESYFE